MDDVNSQSEIPKVKYPKGISQKKYKNRNIQIERYK